MEPLISYEADPQIWVPIRTNSCLYQPSDTVLKSIAKSTGCTIKPDEVSSGYLVSGVYDSEISNALRRLDALNSLELISIPLIYDFLCHEAEIDFNLVVRPLKEGLSKRSKHQLIVPTPETKTFESLLVIMLKDRKGDIVQVKEKARELQPSLLWANHAFRAFGNQASHNNPGATPTSKPPEITSPPQYMPDLIKDWLNGTGNLPEKHLDAFTFVPIMDAKPAQDTDDTAPKLATKRVRKAKRAKDTMEENRAPVSSTDNIAYSIPSSATANTADNGTSLSSLRASSPSDQPGTRNGSAQNGLPTMSPESSDARTSNVLRWKKAIILAGDSCDLLGLSENTNTHRNRKYPIHDHCEPNPREVHRTVERRATVNLVGRTAIEKEYQGKIGDLLAKSRSRPGPLQIELRFGQLLITANSGSLAPRNMAFQEQEWKNAFSARSSYGLKSIFIDRLTTSSAEAETIASIKLRAGRPLFVLQPPRHRCVTYVLNCRSEAKEDLTIGVNENGSCEVKPKEILIGSLNLHYPKRAWDARLAVIGSTLIGCDYTLTADAIANSFTVKTTAASGLEMYVESADQQLKIESIIVRRETLHSSTVYPDLILRLTENQEAYCEPMNGSTDKYIASIKSAKEMEAAQRLWWTASVSSITTSSILQENNSLQLGNAASWNVETIVQNGTISDMASLAEEVVTRIDHIGLSNGVDGNRSKYTVSKTSESTANRQGATIW